MGQGNHPDHPPIEGGYTGTNQWEKPVCKAWRKEARGVYGTDLGDRIRAKYMLMPMGYDPISGGVEERVQGVQISCRGTVCFIPQTILAEVLKDFGYSIVTTLTPVP